MKKSVIMSEDQTISVASNIRVMASLDVKFKNPPKTYKDMLRALEIIKDEYHGYISNKEIILFFYVMNGFFCKYINKVGNFYNYYGTISGSFNLYLRGIKPVFPIVYEYNGDEGGINPNFLITFHISIHETDMTSQSLYSYIKENSPSKYQKRSKVKMAIFQEYPFEVTVKQKIFTLSKSPRYVSSRY